jgi:hypothetical protein
MLAVAIVSSTSTDIFVPTILYIGPDVFVPLTSAIAAVAGLALMFWQKIIGVARTVWRTMFSQRD